MLYFEGERQSTLRVLRAVKNRFGSTNEIGIFEMQAGGMVAVEDASAYMLSSMTRGVAGVSVTCSVEGSRPMMCEVQALVTDTSYGNPRRMCQGVEFNRMVLMIAVLERRAGISLASRDVYMNAVGGMRMAEPSGDLAVIAALASAALDMPLLEDTVFIGEVGLSGEIRHVSQMERRIQECARLGFSTVVLPPTRGVKKEDFPRSDCSLQRTFPLPLRPRCERDGRMENRYEESLKKVWRKWYILPCRLFFFGEI